ncbi:MAG: hypothetical protein C0594_09715, partial [Marinilabiliales bacterium]
ALINEAGDTIAQHGAYQWDVTVSQDICVIADDCYHLDWYGGTSNDIVVSYNGTAVYTQTLTGDASLVDIGDGCQVSINEVENADLTIYPNPTKGIVNITNIENAVVTVYNMVGEVVYMKDSADNNLVIDLSGYAEGTYVVKVVSEEGVATEKVTFVK